MCRRNCCGLPEPKALYRLSNSFPYLLNRVGVRMGELFSRRIAPFGVTLPMYRVMAALWENGDQRLSDLSTVTTTEISTLSRLADWKTMGAPSPSISHRRAGSSWRS